MSLIVDYSEANNNRIYICHIKQWTTSNGFAGNQIVLEKIINNKYPSIKLAKLNSNSDQIYQKLKTSIDRGDSISIAFNSSAGKISNEFVEITYDQFMDMVPNHQLTIQKPKPKPKHINNNNNSNI